jgi:hypothetical protein
MQAAVRAHRHYLNNQCGLEGSDIVAGQAGFTKGAGRLWLTPAIGNEEKLSDRFGPDIPLSLRRGARPQPLRPAVTDRMLILGERHLRVVMAGYAAHYNGRRPHRGRELRPPRPDHPVADLSQARIRRRPVLGGLLNEYQRAA